jgi:hypothetical protein
MGGMQTFDPHKNTTEVRQANRRTMNFRVLIIGLIGLIVAFAIIYGIYVAWPEGNVIS